MLSSLAMPPDRLPRPTMRDVAALADVSLKTVSRVINGETTVAPELAERVRRAATRLDYRPNLTASSLRRTDGKTRTVGLLLEDVSNPFSATLYRAVENVAAQRGVQVLAASLDEDPDRERELVMSLIARRVDGFIIVPAGDDQSYLVNERRAGTTFVFADRQAPAPGRRLGGVRQPGRGGRRRGASGRARPSADRLPRRPALDPDRRRSAIWATSTRSATAGLPVEDSLIVRDLNTAEATEARTLEQLAAARRPDGVVHRPEPGHHRRDPRACVGAASSTRWPRWASTTWCWATCSSPG